ncbi:archaellin/type IV pilin N-terminal domain-containing protein [Salarchaeum sp. JOR-1]|uniref:archaellin/type IV pilin N-terminal domain-containing protein n=1 Tax=Salarchaeum sp. JOR-1 TaxID=2599399 RepID=UPI001198ACF9|nr:archaellin/type IV pilin N-terminal domain-containing protein [Salarchaeum sp. JOR-1]QDX40992.1 hypothetical protein FQU85_08805 [Salarchaeum sp. JOR-1]
MGIQSADRGQLGIETIVVFVAMVLVAALAAGLLVNTAGVLQQASTSTGQESQSMVTDRVSLVSIVGNVSESGNYVEHVRVLIGLSPGSGTVNLSQAVVYTKTDEWSRWTEFNSDDIVLASEDEDCYALTEGELCTTGFDGRLEPGEEITIKIVTASGAVTHARFAIPQAIQGEEAVVLR